MTRIVILDDYLDVSLQSADWASLPEEHPLRRLPNATLTPHIG